MPVLTHANVRGVMAIAAMTLSDNILDVCSTFLKQNIDGRHFDAYDLALSFDLVTLKLFCQDKFIENFKPIMASEMMQCSNDALCRILDLELLCSEKDIFDECMKWSAAMAVTATDSATLRKTLGPCFRKIRFSSLTNEQFCGIVSKHPGLFAESEAFKIFMAISRAPLKISKQTAAGQWPIDRLLDDRINENGEVIIRNFSVQFHFILAASAGAHLE